MSAWQVIDRVGRYCPQCRTATTVILSFYAGSATYLAKQTCEACGSIVSAPVHGLRVRLMFPNDSDHLDSGDDDGLFTIVAITGEMFLLENDKGERFDAPRTHLDAGWGSARWADVGWRLAAPPYGRQRADRAPIR